MLDTKWNNFGGFTPMQWESGFICPKGDGSLRSFIFMLKNPHNIGARRFALKAEKKDQAIYCDFDWVPCFGRDISASDGNNTDASSQIFLGKKYTNNAELGGGTVVTGSLQVHLNEIEVFEITE
jgi:hypothetical protein